MARQVLRRRAFLKGSAAAGAAVGFPYVIMSSALGAGRPAPSNRIVMGFIGVGGKGTGGMRSFLHYDNVQVVAVCDVDKAHRDRAADLVKQQYGSAPAAYKDFRDLVARDDIDAVQVATPDHWHVPTSIAAVRAGMDVYCEKPLTRTIAEGRVLSDAVARYSRIFQTGSQQRSSAGFRRACELVRNGRIGKVHTIRVGLGRSSPSTGPHPEMPVPAGFDYDFWLGPAPVEPYTKARCHGTFRWIRDYSDGKLSDWGAHHFDIVQWALGMDHSGPVDIEGTGKFSDGLYTVPWGYDLWYTYACGARMHCEDSYENGIRFEGSDGWVFVNRGRIDAGPKALLREPLGADDVHLYESRSHMGNFLDGMRTRDETITPAEIGHRSASICHLSMIAILLGRKLRWNAAAERFINDDEANRMLHGAMRSPWTV